MVLPILMLNEPAGVALGVWTALLFCAMRYLLETEKARQGVSATKSGNGLQKTSNIVLSGSYPVFAFFFDFSVAFVVRLLKTFVNKRDLRD